MHVGSLPSSFSKTKHANRMFQIAPQGKRGNMKMPVGSYHGGELRVQNRVQYEYSAPPNLQIKREDANRSVITCHRAMWVQTRLLWFSHRQKDIPGNTQKYTYMTTNHDIIFPPETTRNMIVLWRGSWHHIPPRMIFVSSTTAGRKKF